MGALAGNAAACAHGEYRGENLAAALSWSLRVRCHPAGVETRANFEARRDGRYSDGTIRTASDSKGIHRIVDSTKSKKN